MARKDKIAKGLKNLSTQDRIYVHNEFCYERGDFENVIHCMGDVDDFFCGMKPSEIINAVSDEDFNYDEDDYFIDGMWGLVSYSEDEIDGFMDELVDDISQAIDDGEFLYMDEVKTVLDELEETA